MLAGNKNVDTTVCYHTPSGCLEISDSATGGALPYSYQWQHFSNGGYVDIADSNRESYCPKDSLVQSEYYRLKFISSYGCGAVYSNPVSVHVYPPLTRAKLDVPADTVKVCPGASPGKIPVKISAKGGCGKVNNQWQVKDANGNFKDIADTVIDTLKIMKEMSFRLKSFSECCGDTVFSDTITFSPYPKLIAGKIDKDETICYHTQPSKLFFSESPSGGDGSYTYQWEESSNNILWNVVSGKHVEYQPDILVTTHYYRVVVGSAACPQDTAITNAVTVSVLPEFKPGEVSISGVSSGRDTFCQKIMPDTLKATAATGGKQPYEYQWQSFSNGSYNDINGAKTVILTGIKPSVYYRMKYSSSCGVAYSAPVAVHVYPPLTPAVLETPSSTMVCEGSSLGTLSVKSSASGGCGKVRNQWQVKTANGDFKDMADAETETLNVGEIKEEMSFRLKSFSECCDDTVYSVPVTFSLYPKLSAGKIGKDETICHHTKPSELVFIVNPSGGNGSYTYQWYESKDAIKWDMVHGKHISYQPDTLDATHYYRVVVSSGCPQETDTTNMVEVKVREKLNAGKIYGKPFVCEQSNPRLSFSDLPTGSSGQYHYQWQTSSDFSSFKPVLSNDTICYHDSMAFDSVGMRYYWVLVTSDGCPEDTALTDVMLVKSVPLPEVQRIYGGGDTVCYFQEVTYYVDTLFDACAYEWGLSSNQGVIQSVSNNKVSILWVNNYMEDSVVLKVTDTLANCVQRNARKINISTNKVPEQVKLYRKTNSNVLIADDYSEKLYYRWGYTDKNDASDYFIDSANRRYARFPHLDTKHYFYWLRLSAVKGDSCYSQSVFDETVAQYDIELETGDVRVFVTSPSTISIIVENPKMEQVECRILTPLGQLLYHGQWGRNEYLRQAVPMNVAAGVYFVHVRVGKDVYVKKAVVR